VHVVDEDQDGCAGMAAADAEMVQPAVVPQGELPLELNVS
jgi:hypothetical protein